ncbi:MAG: carbamoyl-phosphate synthase large subunit, partial [Bacteroidota bacterium]
EICYNSKAVREYMKKAVDVSPEYPVLIDRFLEDAFEFDVDAVSDGKQVFIGGVMEHIEEAGIHSGDSACVIPPYMISKENLAKIKSYTVKLSKALKVVGLINVQCAIKDGAVYVIEANPRASRTVPFVSKAIGIPLAKVAAKIMVGRTLEELGVKDFDFQSLKHISVKEAVFPFSKFPRVTVFLGPEMRSTGEVMGISPTFGGAVAKSQIAAGNALPNEGTVFISVNESDKNTITLNIARDIAKLGFAIVATEGTCKFLNEHGIAASHVYKVNEGRPNVVDQIKNKNIQLIINTPLGEESRYDEYAIGWAAIEHKIAFITTLSAAATAVKGIERQKEESLQVKSLQEFHKEIAW